MMCLECASAAAGGAEEEEADAERRRRRRGAQRGAGGGGCCGARGVGAAGAAAADDEVQTLSGSVRRAPSGPPGTPGTPGCAAAAKGPGAQQPKPASLGRGRGAAAAILSLGNVLNYLDRYTVAGGCADLGHGGLWCQKKSGLHLAGSGDPQSTTAALLGELIQASFWTSSSSLGSRTEAPACCSQHFWLLVLSRGLVGIGEASYSTIAPTIIGDLFTKNTRTLMLSVFYFAIPLGSGLGYITGSSVKQAAGDWRWALRVSPIVGMITGTLILILVPATKRGHADQLGGQLKVRTSWLRDMKALIRNRSYVFSSLATSAVSFATGALGMWIPLYLHRAQVVQKTADTCSSPPCGAKDSLIFGAITCFTGFLGVVTGAGATRWCRLRTQRADPLVCAVGMLGSAIFVCLIFVAAKSSIVGAYVCIFVGETLLFSNWAITADILMYVVIPTRRATAVALQSFTSHLLGDAGSPYLIGFISDLIRQSTKDSPLWEFLSLGYALMLCPFVVVLGGMFFLATALFFLGDRAKAEQQALPPSPGADEVPARHVRPAGPRDAMRQSSARARPQLIRHLDPRPSLPQGEPAGDATRTRQSLRPCPQDGEETVPSPYLGGVPGHPGPAGLTRSFLCDPRLGTHPLWCGPAEWPWHQEAASSTDVEGCVWGSRTDGQTPSRWGPGRTQPPARVWGEPGASPPYMVLGGWTFPRDSFGDPGLHREGAAQASGRSFRL
ncbi:sphingosine-1-phosphate transporter SPNS2 isoform X3 [Acinonyx jubatus]|uniref:Sphingosine-1-phosphate transporter SPNS2 isoform X3 n=1 Tax=Acinonyx jubatus TaxID=32536 RepID=A0ABM3PAJ0_ACIJB|nr:sphingosine-1-phosphate transporter SPNS2 isoform X3 [Acinonyx jubatus]